MGRTEEGRGKTFTQRRDVRNEWERLMGPRPDEGKGNFDRRDMKNMREVETSGFAKRLRGVA